jgi:hypothetical protein
MKGDVTTGGCWYTYTMLWHYTRRDTKVLLLATLLVFAAYGLLLAQDIMQTKRMEVALEAQTVGIFASVPENEVSKFAIELKQWEGDLSAREAALARAERANIGDTRTPFYVFLVGAGLLGLILLNFYLDSRRRLSLT